VEYDDREAQPVFLGEFDHSLDVKGRLILPAGHRDLLGDSGFITKALDPCLAIYRPEEFEEVSKRMEEYGRRGPTERDIARLFTSRTRPITPDKQGRVAIPAPLRNYAGLSRDVMVIGASSRIEIWGAEQWAEVQSRAEEGLRRHDPALDNVGI
jgi:MraZ protein